MPNTAVMHDDLLSALDLDLVFVTGKGGVGKSLVAAALAGEAARMGMRPLVVGLGSRGSMEAVFGAQVGQKPTSVGFGVHALAIDTDDAVIDYFAEHLPAPRLARAFAGNSVIRALLRAAPGVPEFLALDRLRAALDELDPADGHPRFRPVIVDLDATGHARMFFDLPRVLKSFASGGPLAATLEGVEAMLRSPATGVCLVGEASKLAVAETLELYRDIVETHQMLVAGLVINRLDPDPLGGLDPEAFERYGTFVDGSDDPVLQRFVDLARRLRGRHHQVRAAVEELRSTLDTPCIELPRLEIPLGRAALARLGPYFSGHASASFTGGRP